MSVGNRTISNQFVSQHVSSSKTGGAGEQSTKISQKDDSCTVGPEEQDRSFDTVRVKYIILHSVKSVIFTKISLV